MNAVRLTAAAALTAMCLIALPARAETFLTVGPDGFEKCRAATTEVQREELERGDVFPTDKETKRESVWVALPGGARCRVGVRLSHAVERADRPKCFGVIPESVQVWTPNGHPDVRLIAWATYVQGIGGYYSVGTAVLHIVDGKALPLHASELLVHWSAGWLSGGSGARTISVQDRTLTIEDIVSVQHLLGPTGGSNDSKTVPPLYRKRQESALASDGDPNTTCLIRQISEKTIRTCDLSVEAPRFLTRHYYRNAEATAAAEEIAAHYHVPLDVLFALNGTTSAEELARMEWIEIPSPDLTDRPHKRAGKVEPEAVERLRTALGDVSKVLKQENGNWYLRVEPKP